MLKNVRFPLVEAERFDAAVLNALAIVALLDAVVGSAKAITKRLGACQPDAVIWAIAPVANASTYADFRNESGAPNWRWAGAAGVTFVRVAHAARASAAVPASAMVRIFIRELLRFYSDGTADRVQSH
jgi:hypothetical protein